MHKPAFSKLFFALLMAVNTRSELFADLMIMDSGRDRILLASSVDGTILNANWLVDTTLQTPVKAIYSGRGTIFISDQLAGVIKEYSFPTMGSSTSTIFVDNTKIANNRGIAVWNNHLYVTVAGGTFANTVQRFNLTTGAQSTFISSNLGNPWDIAFRANDVLVTNSTGGITQRFDLNGNYLGPFSPVAITNPRQIHLEADGDVTIGNNSGGIVRFAADGTFQAAFGPTTARGVYQLDNGNYMYGSGINLGIHDVATNTNNIISAVSGNPSSYQYITFVDLTAVPEPSSVALLASAGLLGLLLRWRTAGLTVVLHRRTSFLRGKLTSISFGFFAAVLSLGIFVAPEASADIIITVNATGAGNFDRVIRMDSSGGSVQTLFQAPTSENLSPRGVTYNPLTDRVIWSDINRSFRSVPSSGGTTTVDFTRPSSAGLPNSLAFDPAGNDLYATEFLASPSVRTITKMETDGSGASTFHSESTINGNSWLTIDSNKLYFSNSGGKILSKPLSGSVASDVVTGLSNDLRGIAVWGDTIYWLDNVSDTLNSRSISNSSAPISSVSIVAPGGSGATPQGLATDGQYLFYAEALSSALGIYRYNMDLTGRTTLITFAANNIPNGITVVPTAVPEPSSLAMLTIAGLIAIRCRRRA